MNHLPRAAYRESLSRSWMVYCLLLPVLLSMFVSTTIVPNNWEYFTANRIASYAAKQMTSNFTLCGADWQHYACPELPWAIFKTTNIQLSDSLYLKMFPGNVAWYMFLAVVPAVGLAIRTFMPKVGALRIPLRARIICQFVGKRFFSVGELGMVLAVLTLCTVWTLYWMHDHNYNGYWDGTKFYEEGSTYTNAEWMARFLGQLAIVLMSLLLFPTAKYSVLSMFFGTSWEASIRYHRWLGSAFLLAVVGHIVANYWWYASVGHLPSIYKIPMKLSTSIDNFTVPLISWIMWACLFTIGGFAMFQNVRRKYYELFLYAHHASYLALIPATLWHAAAAWEFLLPGLMIWFVDRCIRFYRSSQKVNICSVKCEDYGQAGRVTELVCSAPFDFHPGHYAFVNVAELSLLEWHPFTISSHEPGTVSFHIKDMGPGTFTERLGNMAAKQESITVSLDGPVGTPVDFHKYSAVVLVAGGIGITPCKCIFEHLLSAPMGEYPLLRRVHLIWASRDAGIFKMMKKSLQSHSHPEQAPVTEFSADYFVTKGGAQGRKTNPETELSTESFKLEEGRGMDVVSPSVYQQRPNILENCRALNIEPELEALMFVCGPDPLVEQAEDAAHELRWELHSETFAL